MADPRVGQISHRARQQDARPRQSGAKQLAREQPEQTADGDVGYEVGQIQMQAMGSNPLGILRSLAKLDNEEV